MRKLLLILLMLLNGSVLPAQILAGVLTVPITTPPGIGVVAHVVGTTANGNTTTTPSINTSGSSLIVFYVSCVGTFYANIVAISDNKGNTYPLIRTDESLAGSSRFYYCNAPSTGAGHTFTAAGTNKECVIYILALRGTKPTGPIDQQNGNPGGSGALTTIQPGSVTPTAPGSIVISGLHNYNNPVPNDITINSSMIISDQTYYHSGGLGYAGALAYRIQTVAAPINPSWFWTSANAWDATSIITILPQ